mgnify:FL=1
MGKYLLAHDIGTSGNKATLFAVEGKLIKSTHAAYDVSYGEGGIAEQNPEDWWKAVCACTKEIMEGIEAEDILAVSFSAQMQCCLVVDKEGVPLRPAMIWADTRAKKQAEELAEKLSAMNFYELLGHPISPSYSIEKLMWIRDHEPEVYEKTHKMLQVKDYIICRMTGAFVTDHSDASGTNAYDLTNQCWSKEVLEAANISEDKLPVIHASTDVIGQLKESAAKELGLSVQTKVVCGGGDGACSALGAGCVEAGEMFLCFGTSAWIAGTTDKKVLDDAKECMCFAHVIPGKYVPCGTMQSAGSAYSYIRNTFCQDVIKEAKVLGKSSWELMNQLAENSPAGSKGLIFLPYLAGERSPRWNPDASGSFLGIRMYHEKADYIRAVLEGVAMNMELILKAHRKNIPVQKMILTGGGAKGDIVAKILADMLETEMKRPDYMEESTSIAAAVVAGVGCGVYEDFHAIHKFITFGEPIVPDLSVKEVYDERKKVFDAAYHALKSLYKVL